MKIPHSITSRIILVTGLILLDCLFFGLTNPLHSWSLVLIIGFCLMAITVCYGVYMGLLGLTVLFPGLKGKLRPLTMAATATLTLLLALQSLGQLTARDGIVLLLIVTISYFYASRYSFGNSSASRKN